MAELSMDTSRRKTGWWTRFMRLMRMKLIVPLKRGNMDPAYMARGVAVGLAVAFTPTVGVQLIAVLGIWLFARAFTPRWDFHLVAGMAWVWLTNIFTIGPIYYTFFLTGQMMLGRFDALGVGFGQFTNQLQSALTEEVGFFESLWVYTYALFDTWGLPLFLGCIPWAIGLAWLGYAWSYRFVAKLQLRRAEARRRKAAEND